MNLKKELPEMCNCDCHDDGTNLMHCVPCCNYTYQKRSQYTQEKSKDEGEE